MLGWRGIPYERIVYGYGDTVTPVEKFGKKLLPVLEYSKTGSEEFQSLRESLDIVKFIDTLNGEANATLSPPTNRFDHWIGDVKPAQRILAR